jgi:hypothetical protein
LAGQSQECNLLFQVLSNGDAGEGEQA